MDLLYIKRLERFPTHFLIQVLNNDKNGVLKETNAKMGVLQLKKDLFLVREVLNDNETFYQTRNLM